jgi:hypothetical protein
MAQGANEGDKMVLCGIGNRDETMFASKQIMAKIVTPATDLLAVAAKPAFLCKNTEKVRSVSRHPNWM